jgi:hypothetical protein
MPQPKRVLRNLKISEVSTVDKAANQHARVAFWKRDDPGRVFRKIFGCETLRDVLDKAERNPSLPRLRDLDPPRDPDVDVIDPDEEADDDEGDGDETEDASKHFVSTLADLLVEGGGAPDRKTALHHLMHTARGAELFRRLNKQRQKKERTTMTTTREQELSAIAKKYGVAAVCKHIIDHGSSISEHELTKLIGDNIERRSGETPAQAFSRVYTSDEGLVLRKAVNACKTFDQQPPKVRAEPKVTAVVAGDGLTGDALAQLEALVAELRRAHPEMSKAQAFAKVYTDPANAELAKRERQQNRPRAA